MKILVIGSGGREHALAKKFLSSKKVSSVFCAPGNPGMTLDGIVSVAIDMDDFGALINFVKSEEVDWTFVGSEAPLFEGIVDAFEAEGQTIFGPSKAAAQIEGSKHFAKQLMAKYDIPTAKFTHVTSYEEATLAMTEFSYPVVIKADGPAAGKGVVIAENHLEADQALKELFVDFKYSNQPEAVIEEFMVGPEYSVFSFVYNGQMYHTPAAQDHKRAYDGDEGPNTGGMGAYAPVPFVTDEVMTQTINTVISPTIRAMEAEGVPYNGILYSGLILTDEGPKVIEFNCRFGDPETQIILDLLESDLAQAMDDLIHGHIAKFDFPKNKSAFGVIIAADGYPEAPINGVPLPKVNLPGNINIYYAGVQGTYPFTSKGGRILMVTSTGPELIDASNQVYNFIDANPIEGTFYRTDIGKQAL